ncbi:MAG: nucleotidyltransferase domain-containing protein [Hadesarchaea archaeon]|nr:nucleotidyltransferase domain-containing protein [Hadesarchaea archaeon]
MVTLDRGRYRFVPPSVWASIVQASIKFPRLLDFPELFAQEGVMGIYLYGSWARGEASKDSDYDLLIIIQDPSRARLKQKPPGADVRIFGIKETVELMKKDPILIVPILQESVPIYGAELLNYLKSLGFSKERLLAPLREALVSIGLAERLVKATSGSEVDSTLLYPVMLRFRQYCLTRSIVDGIPGTLKQAEAIAEEHGIGKKEFWELYGAFRSEQQGIQRKISKSKLIKFLKLVRALLEEYIKEHQPKEIKTARQKRLEELKEEFKEVLRVAKKEAA